MIKGDDTVVTYDKNTKYINMLKGISVIVLYFTVSLFKTLPLDILNIDYTKLSLLTKEIYSVSVEVLMILAIFLIFKDQFIKAFKDLKKNHLNYFKGNFKYYLLGVIIMMLSNSLITILGGGTSDNETAVRLSLIHI